MKKEGFSWWWLLLAAILIVVGYFVAYHYASRACFMEQAWGCDLLSVLNIIR